MGSVLIVSLSVDDPERAEAAIENGTLIPFLTSHVDNIAAVVIDEDDTDD